MAEVVESIIIHKADTRGHANHGWLDSYHSFSFAGYHNPDRIHFGALRVLNDDIINANSGFGTHPHDNMEIITIPLYGSLEHRDTTGRHEIIRTGDVQIMSAGSGIAHSEYNPSDSDPVNLFQIWIFPKHRNIEPRYEQKTFDANARKNKWQLVVSPDGAEGSLTTDQDTWLTLGKLDKGANLNYDLRHEGSYGVYVMLIDGSVKINGQALAKRDAIGLVGVNNLDIVANEPSEILLIEVP